LGTKDLTPKKSFKTYTMNEIEDVNFKLTTEGIHLIRNKFTYHLIEYHEVESAFLKEGRLARNWIIVLFFGGISLFLAIFLLFHLVNGVSIDEKTVRFYYMFGQGLIAVFVLVGAGIFSIYSALTIVPIIVVNSNGKIFQIRLLKSQKRKKEILEILNSNGVKV
jgi:hypothetical protein